MRLDDDYPGEWEDRRRAEQASDALLTLICVGWWLIPLLIFMIIDWVKSLI